MTVLRETGKNPCRLLHLLDQACQLQEVSLGAIERHRALAEPGDIRRISCFERRDHLGQPLSGANLRVLYFIFFDPGLLDVGVTLLFHNRSTCGAKATGLHTINFSRRAACARRTNHQGAVVASAARVPVCCNTSRRVNITFTDLPLRGPWRQTLYHPMAEPCELGEETTPQTEYYGRKTLHSILSTSTLLCYPSAYRA